MTLLVVLLTLYSTKIVIIQFTRMIFLQLMPLAVVCATVAASLQLGFCFPTHSVILLLVFTYSIHVLLQLFVPIPSSQSFFV